MFARVVPAVRTPTGLDGFDYAIPAGMTVVVGQLVIVPFRRYPIPAIVVCLLDQSPFAAKAKPISALYGSVIFPSSTLDLLAWTAKRTFCSQPTILKAWLRELPKRQPADLASIDLRERKREGGIETIWAASYENNLIEKAKQLQTQGHRILLITPWQTRAARYAAALDAPLLGSDQTPTQAFQSWAGFLETSTGCLVTTRLGAWLSSAADIVLLDEPENDDHKQDEIQPRYDARRLVSWCARYGGTSVYSFGRTPPLHVDQPAPLIELPLIIHPHHPQGRSAIPCIQADSLLTLQEHQGPRIIIHPIRGLLARLQCRDCGWQATCTSCGFPLSAESALARCRRCNKTSSLPLTCPTCGGSELNKSIPGIDRLKQAWQTHCSDLEVEWRDLSNEQLDPPFPEGSLVLLTQPRYLGGGPEDLRRKERQCIILRRLAARIQESHGQLILQSEEDEIAQWSSWLTPDGVASFFEDERTQRRLFSYPPTARRIKLILEGTEPFAQSWKDKVTPRLPATASWEGPFPVAYRRQGQTSRVIWHVILPADTPEAELLRAFEPFANEALIDLDPIAFFA